MMCVGARRLPERVQPAVDCARGGAARVPARRAAAAALARVGDHLRQPPVRAPQAGEARGREQHERQPLVQGRHRPVLQPELRRRALTPLCALLSFTDLQLPLQPTNHTRSAIASFSPRGSLSCLYHLHIFVAFLRVFLFFTFVCTLCTVIAAFLHFLPLCIHVRILLCF